MLAVRAMSTAGREDEFVQPAVKMNTIGVICFFCISNIIRYHLPYWQYSLINETKFRMHPLNPMRVSF